MTADEMRAAASELTILHERFAPGFGRKEAREHSRVYLQGLLLRQGRKSVEPIALDFAHQPGETKDQLEVLALQRFITHSPWESGAIQREIQAVFGERLRPSTQQWDIGTVGVIDESGFEKKGEHSV